MAVSVSPVDRVQRADGTWDYTFADGSGIQGIEQSQVIAELEDMITAKKVAIAISFSRNWNAVRNKNVVIDYADPAPIKVQ